MTAARQAFFERRIYGIVIIPSSSNGICCTAGRRRSPLRRRQLFSAVFPGGDCSEQRHPYPGMGGEIARLIARGTDRTLATAAADPTPLTRVPLFNPQGGYAKSYIVPPR